MTPEQSQKTDALHSRIAQNEAILNSLKQSDGLIESQKKSPIQVKFSYTLKDEIACEILIDPEWFHSPELKSDFHYCVKVAKDGFIELLEKDLKLMKEGLGKML
jgi:hypothetical protein